MRVLVLGAQKGGAGKSTLCLSLAVAALLKGERVAGLDADPQRSFARWGERRGGEGIIVRAVEVAEIPTYLGRAERNGFTLAIVDTPGRLDAAVTQVLRRASFVLVPCQPQMMDVEATIDLVPVLQSIRAPFGFALTRTFSRSSGRVEEARAALSEHGPVFPGSVRHLTAHEDAIITGKSVIETDPAMSGDITGLWEWTEGRLTSNS